MVHAEYTGIPERMAGSVVFISLEHDVAARSIDVDRIPCTTHIVRGIVEGCGSVWIDESIAQCDLIKFRLFIFRFVACTTDVMMPSKQMPVQLPFEVLKQPAMASEV